MGVRGFLAFIFALAIGGLAAVPAVAQQQIVAPPGNSAVDEYTEVVPGAGGDRPTSGATGTNAQSPVAVLGGENVQQLEQLGADGRAAAQVAAAGAPAKVKDNGKVLGDREGQSIAAQDGGGRAQSIASALAGDGGGMGLLFPLLLAGTLVTAVAVLGARRASRQR
jgi:hypothetical protein